MIKINAAEMWRMFEKYIERFSVTLISDGVKIRPRAITQVAIYAMLLGAAYILTRFLAETSRGLGFTPYPGIIVALMVLWFGSDRIILFLIRSIFWTNRRYRRLFFTEAKTMGIGRRVDGRKYSDLPDGHRTTLVVGMCDMLNLAALYAAPEHEKRLEAMLHYERKMESGALRQKFDEYMASDVVRLNYAVASCFINALNQWCGFDKIL